MADSATKSISITSLVSHHFGSVRTALFGIPYWVWPLPFLLSAGILLLLPTPAAWLTGKPLQEVMAPWLVGLTAVFATIVHRRVGTFFSLLLACFVWALFLRELHFWGTDKGFFIAVLALAWWASLRRDEIRDYLSRQMIGGLLSGALWTYFVAMVFDYHVLSFLPAYYDWTDNIEETLENLGHLMVVGAVVATLRIGKHPDSAAQTAKNANS